MLSYFAFLIVIKLHQHLLHERLEAEQLISLVIPESEFRWHKTGREILIDNKHFDCKEVKKIGERYYVTGIFDTEEDLLEQELEGAVRHSTESNWLSEDSLFLVFFSVGHSLHLAHPALLANKNSLSLFCDSYTSIYPEVLSPPPNQFG